ncbi:DUF6875 domain-containing protein [Amycolatopsis cihanbeyliensis]|uniref:DUF6875 domain-containing protein n=1 Tax=Amycolatopsis cihanbeyliensis TaxID=1128664 RepID=A0A542DBL9_AMYCI|nr:hypothetical protein [Amycolatopsis cihanbeyliensis]TQJ00471.1 hypothetical protein FB471_0095 [Amycolatopsis cihanbeyliensis]
MLIHPTRPVYPLIEPSDFAAARLPDAVAEHEDSLRRIHGWAREYLCRPNPRLGRRGDVCPFTGTSLRKGLFLVSVHTGQPADPAELSGLLLHYRDWFTELSPRTEPDAQFTTILVLFPNLTDVTLIDRTQGALKREYTESGLMIGEFHPGPPDKGGLWNPDFRPLRAPLPLLAIRHMVPTDLPFLRDDEATVAAYLRRFGDRLPRTSAAR